MVETIREIIARMPVRVRDGRIVAPTCFGCGCRLEVFSNGDLFHFTRPFNPADPWDNRDARGCRCVYIDFLWDANGKILYC